MDVTLSALALIALSPLLAGIALAIRVTSGRPLLYSQNRVTLGGRRFRICKFRTMTVDAETGLGPMWSLRQDPRCTPLGSLLRRTGFDELPQLWNVLIGDMSLVGPRPERPEFIRGFKREFRDYNERHRVRAGLTGYAQARGWRGDTSIEQRVKHDLYYVRNWSLWLDLKILALTLVRGWSERTLPL